MTSLPEITQDGVLTRPAKHGWALDYATPEGRRVQVRVFAFEPGYMGGVACEMPSAMSQKQAVDLLRLGAAKIQKLGEAAGAEEFLKLVASGILTPEDVSRTGETVRLLNLGMEGTGKEEESDAAQVANGAGTLGTTGPTIRRVLFLDVDGVLNTRPGSLDEDKLELLRHLIVMSGASVVVSSSWRTVPEQYERLLKALAGIGVVPIGCTPDLTIEKAGIFLSKDRWQEIQAWLDAHPTVDQWVILDDCLYMGPLASWHVRTILEWGLTGENVTAAAEDFKRQALAKHDWCPMLPSQAGKEAA